MILNLFNENDAMGMEQAKEKKKMIEKPRMFVESFVEYLVMVAFAPLGAKFNFKHKTRVSRLSFRYVMYVLLSFVVAAAG